MDQVTIIAEIGINHNGSVEIAKDMIRMANECHSDYVKFQKRDITTVYSQKVLDTPRKSPWGETTRQQKEGLEFNQEQYEEIDLFCKNIGIPWFASAWDIPSLEFLDQFKCQHQKVASAMATHRDFLKQVASRKKHTYLSTGMCTIKDIEDAVDIFARVGCSYTLMHSVSTYPCGDEETNLQAIPMLLKRFGPPVGYSSHDVGLLPSIVAVVLGATTIEKHITMDRASYGSDQAASVERDGLRRLVKECKGVDVCLGDGRKTIKEVEQSVAKKLRYWEGDE